MSDSTKSTSRASVGSAAAREGYEAKVAVQALQRAGRNPQLHGTVHELMYVDRLNVNPVNILKGKRAFLTKSTTAVRDDVILKQGGKVIQRMQLKDTAGSIQKTVSQAASGKYAGTNLMGTVETTKAYGAEVAKRAKSGTQVAQQMRSTGISSKDTMRVADKALGRMPTAKSLAAGARSAGIVGAAIGAGVEAVSGIKQLRSGELTAGEYAGRVAKEGVKGAVTGSAATTASSVIAGGAGTLLATTTAPAWVPVAVGTAAAVAVGAGVKRLLDRFF